MNYYPFHIGDFRSGTVNMSRQSRWIYRDMLDVYYDAELPLALDLDVLCDEIGVESDEERKIVERLLRFKFEKTDKGYRHAICDKVIAEYHQKAETAKANGKLGGRPPKPKANQKEPSGLPVGSNPVATANPVAPQSEANQEPITKNHKPGKSKTSATAARLPADWKPSDDDIEFCKTKRPDLNPVDTANQFRDFWIGVPGVKGRKLDWPATWRNWVRNQRAVGVQQSKFQSKNDRIGAAAAVFGHSHGRELTDVN